MTMWTLLVVVAVAPTAAYGVNNGGTTDCWSSWGYRQQSARRYNDGKNKQPHGPGQISPSFGPLSPCFCSDARCFRRRLQW